MLLLESTAPFCDRLRWCGGRAEAPFAQVEEIFELFAVEVVVVPESVL